MDPAVRELLEGPNIGHMATLMADGTPHSVALWVPVVEDDRVAVAVPARSLKARNMARDPRVALSVVHHENPYHTAQARGRVVATRTGEEAWDLLNLMARRYTGADYPGRVEDLVAYEIEIDWERVTDVSI